MSRLSFTTRVAAPLTVAFDVARALGRPWPVPLEEVVSVRPARDVYAVGPGSAVAQSTCSSTTVPAPVAVKRREWVSRRQPRPGPTA